MNFVSPSMERYTDSVYLFVMLLDLNRREHLLFHLKKSIFWAKSHVYSPPVFNNSNNNQTFHKKLWTVDFITKNVLNITQLGLRLKPSGELSELKHLIRRTWGINCVHFFKKNLNMLRFLFNKDKSLINCFFFEKKTIL